MFSINLDHNIDILCAKYAYFWLFLHTLIYYSLVGNNEMSSTKTAKLQNPKYQTCVDSCNNCCESCEACCTACLMDQKNVGMTTRCIMIMRDCMDMCITASCFMSRGSENVKQVCNMCADVCEACAMECEKLQDKMEECRQCAQACRMCAQECRNMTR